MAIVYTQQYQPISNAETCANAALSIRFVRDLDNNLNNMKRYALNSKVRCDMWTAESAYCTTQSPAGLSELVTEMYCPVDIPDGYNKLRWHISARVNEEAGQSGNYVLCRLYSMASGDVNALGVTSNTIPYPYSYSQVSVNSSSYYVYMGETNICKSQKNETWLMLTTIQSAIAAEAIIPTLDVWPVM